MDGLRLFANRQGKVSGQEVVSDKGLFMMREKEASKAGD
jgi:hypothetical protein